MKQLKELIFQLIPVAVGVYLGILGGNCNEQKRHQNNQEELLTNIALELKSNQEKLQFAYDYHTKIGEKVDSMLNNSSKERLDSSFFASGGFFAVPGWRGVMLPPLERSVFESGIIGNLMSGMDFQTLNKISKIYNRQKEYKNFTQTVTNKIIAADISLTTESMLNDMLLLKYDIPSIEKGLISDIDKMIEHLEEKFD